MARRAEVEKLVKEALSSRDLDQPHLTLQKLRLLLKDVGALRSDEVDREGNYIGHPETYSHLTRPRRVQYEELRGSSSSDSRSPHRERKVRERRQTPPSRTATRTFSPYRPPPRSIAREEPSYRPESVFATPPRPRRKSLTAVVPSVPRPSRTLSRIPVKRTLFASPDFDEPYLGEEVYSSSDDLNVDDIRPWWEDSAEETIEELPPTPPRSRGPSSRSRNRFPSETEVDRLVLESFEWSPRKLQLVLKDRQYTPHQLASAYETILDELSKNPQSESRSRLLELLGILSRENLDWEAVGDASIISASLIGDLHLLKTLAEKLDLDEVTEDILGFALFEAATSDPSDPKIVSILLDHVSPDIEDGLAFIETAAKGNIETIRVFIDRGVNLARYGPKAAEEARLHRHYQVADLIKLFSP